MLARFGSIAWKFAALATLAGCGSLAPSTPGTTLVLVGVPEPVKVSMTIDGHPDAKASMERSLGYVSQMRRNESDLRKALDPLSFKPGAEIESALAGGLAQPGRTLLRVPSPQANRSELLRNYGSLAPGDGRRLYLDVVPHAVGYWNGWPLGDWRPWVVLRWRLVDGAQGKELAGGFIGTGPAPDDETITAVPPVDAYAFRTVESLLADPPRALAGLRAGIAQVAAALAKAVDAAP